MTCAKLWFDCIIFLWKTNTFEHIKSTCLASWEKNAIHFLGNIFKCNSSKENISKPTRFLGYIFNCLFSRGDASKSIKTFLKFAPKSELDKSTVCNRCDELQWHDMSVNTLRAKFFRGSKKDLHLHFMSLLHIDMAQIVEIFP